ncbi:MAG: hypothetical protein H6828_16430 [Planctomycetes bacterium]|nr:hypothetical protein [Planctomycetota bacterium]
MRTSLLVPFVLALAGAAQAQGLADLSLSPPAALASVGDVVEVRLVATAQNASPTAIGALDAVLVYDAAVLQLLGSDQTGAGYAWLAAGFFNDPDGINTSIADGDAIFTALAQITTPASAPPPPGLVVTTLRFQALAPSAGSVVSFAPTMGSFASTKVLDFFVPGQNITGDIGATAVITIAGAPALYCEGTSGACPCANAGGPGEGCRNSSGAGATITFTGSTSVGANDLALTATQLPTNQNGLFYMGPNQIQLPFGDGLRCVGGGGIGLVRFPIGNSGASGTLALPAGFVGSAPIAPGSTWNFQAWFRDPPGPCGNVFNLSSALTATFVP